ncbi:MAG: DUF86 domain-containing protein [Spirochaetales bacterium]|nr:DUF86 domain-containing protein [Spirochaetales bacterium]
MCRRDRANLLAVLDAIERIQEYIQQISSPIEYYESHLVFDATLMNFIVIGKMSDRLSSELKDQYPEVDWQKIKDFRNFVAHDYLGIDAEEVWQIVRNDLPDLYATLRRILDTLAEDR